MRFGNTKCEIPVKKGDFRGDFFLGGKVFPNKSVFFGTFPFLMMVKMVKTERLLSRRNVCHNASSQLRGRETAAGSASVIRNTIGNTITNTNTRETAALAGPGSLKYIWTILPFASLNFSN